MRACDHDSSRHVPASRGKPKIRQKYRRDFCIGPLRTNLEVPFSLAARLVGELKGTASQICLAMNDTELTVVGGGSPNTRVVVDVQQQRRGGYMQNALKDDMLISPGSRTSATDSYCCM